jgi:[ribosomal protein S5]-alanine N-acetyltransferase
MDFSTRLKKNGGSGLDGSSLDEFEILTARLIVRPTREDEADLLLGLKRDRRVSSRFIVLTETSDQEARSFLVQGPSTWENERCIQFTAFDRKESPRLSTVVGAARLQNQELSYYIDPLQWQQGYGYELVHAVVGLAREKLNLEKLSARVLRENFASWKILERLGFCFCGLNYRPDASGRALYPVLHFELSLR